MDINESKELDFILGEILVVDKPLDWTSNDVVQKVRNTLCRYIKVKKLKLGHAGTLDPKATGLMVLCSGKLTKMIDTIQADEKEYIARLKLGATTPSYDLETEEDAHFPIDQISQESVESVLKKFIGTIEQVPPAFSAVKVDGKRAYQLARKGKEVELKSKILVIKEIELLSFDLPEIEIRVVCSKGTYIRALARDIGTALDSGAYLIGLRRTRIGKYTLKESMKMEELNERFSVSIQQQRSTIL